MKSFIQTPQLHFNPIFHFVSRLHTGLGFVNSLDSRNNLYSHKQTLTGMRASNIVPEFCSQHTWNGILVATSKAMSSAHLGHTAGLCLWAWGAIACLWKLTQRIPQISQVFPRYPEFLKFEYSLGYVSYYLNKQSSKQTKSQKNQRRQNKKHNMMKVPATHLDTSRKQQIKAAPRSINISGHKRLNSADYNLPINNVEKLQAGDF